LEEDRTLNHPESFDKVDLMDKIILCTINIGGCSDRKQLVFYVLVLV